MWRGLELDESLSTPLFRWSDLTDTACERDEAGLRWAEGWERLIGDTYLVEESERLRK